MTIPMPDPFGWLLDCLPNDSLAFQRERPSEMHSLVNSTVAVITTTQAEAYAEARVKEALKRAIAICVETYDLGQSEYSASRNPYFEGACDAAESIEFKILAFIPHIPGQA